MYRRSAAAAVLLAAALTLTACSSGGDGKDEVSAASPKPPAVSSAPDPADATDTPAPASPDAKPTGPVLPDAKLVPKTGSFTAPQKQYLSGRVPEKMDPAAVLQSGQEACQRVERTAKRDKDAAVGALVAGEIPGAKDAITFLCPEQKPVLDAAAKGFPDGTKESPAAGTYRALTQSTTCTWEAKGKDGAALASGPETPLKPGDKITAKIPAGTAQFVSNGCYAWIPA
ncbi:hypothetical protein OG898_04435 [Streptomyces sp. NBC_00193]|uniref:hypothetical protein n=1 Tax=Streptomyces sp. NBC_00193 TaxID=2975675 RepID=UPI00225C04FC|nr:hypothetical protein [Streptomyces sp. NBC_00193]MCX5295736.1 hypothetical protein [Streptomyces sp. NBC_00193]